ncbi:Haloacid dehalogenase superfamily protein isoform 1 [Theobroma cacao]|uniref:Haloacid dehalogenase superfamily protein isoform 1 n=1 Tax=Theobroma cacao TaxID=3641 RepID=A0A061DK24_THECC|nr:Haloacid dehalogenase superfamily protein isoform 1 [Theobroma cacao]
MQPVAVAAFPNCCYPVPNRFLHFHFKENPSNLSFPRNQSHIRNLCSLTLPTTTSNFSKPHQENQNRTNSHTYPDQKSTFLDQFYSSFSKINVNNQDPDPQNEDKEENKHPRKTKFWHFLGVIFTNMWWTDLKAAVGQRINVEGIVSSVGVFVRDRHLALPHVAVRDIRCIDWNELHRRGFKGVVFDKDNTITAPYSLTLWPPLEPSIEQCKDVFGPDIAVFSNSAGLLEYDHDGSKAKKLEGTIGIKVIRHRVKKPAGTAEEIEKHFGCQSSQLIMVGDRPFTDVVYGNRNGFLTILTEPLSLVEEPFIVRQVRRLELTLINRWFRRGLKPISHNLLPDTMHCVKDPSPLCCANNCMLENVKLWKHSG